MFRPSHYAFRSLWFICSFRFLQLRQTWWFLHDIGCHVPGGNDSSWWWKERHSPSLEKTVLYLQLYTPKHQLHGHDIQSVFFSSFYLDYIKLFVVGAGQIGEGYFCSARFTPPIVEFLPKMIPLTRHVWQQTKTKMLPTPAKFHYVFNLRDLSRIWQGILTVQDLECRSISSLLKLWRHECTRVISDR